MDELKVKRASYVKLPVFSDDRGGQLAFMEANNQVPHAFPRTYFINGLSTESVKRGLHAHHRLEQTIFCVNGSFDLLLDDGKKSEVVTLKADGVGVYMGVYLWHSMSNFSNGCVLLVQSSTLFDANDYIDDYEEFKTKALTL